MGTLNPTIDANAEVRGHLLLAVLESLGEEKARSFIETHEELTWISPDEWYPLPLMTHIFNELRALYPELDIVEMGKRAATLQNDSVTRNTHFARIVNSLNAEYQRNHRGGKAGQLSVELITFNHVVIDANVPYPDDFIYGEIYQLASRYLPDFNIRYDELRSRREQGGYSTRVHVEWE